MPWLGKKLQSHLSPPHSNKWWHSQILEQELQMLRQLTPKRTFCSHFTFICYTKNGVKELAFHRKSPKVWKFSPSQDIKYDYQSFCEVRKCMKNDPLENKLQSIYYYVRDTVQSLIVIEVDHMNPCWDSHLTFYAFLTVGKVCKAIFWLK